MISKQEVYYAKIMLFGEYSVICDSMALTIPYAHFKGELSFINDERFSDYYFAQTSNKYLAEYLEYLKELKQKGQLKFKFDLERFEDDINRGLYFESTIPQGYGIGSSGALCAALYNNYAVNGIVQKRFLTPDDISLLKNIFSQMESYFHGISSGIDPLLSFIKYPLLVKSTYDIQSVGIPRNKFEKGGAIFLVNTGKPGMTGPLVKQFFKRCSEENFKQLVDDELIPVNNACINALLGGEMKTFFKHLEQLSRFQLTHFKSTIPDGYEHVWEHGLQTHKYLIKLCGSGGGGFLLGFTDNYDHARDELKKLNIDPILVYLNI